MVTPSAISASSRGSVSRDELVLARRAQRRDGRDDAAAGARDLLVARAVQAQLELVGAVAGVDEVGVAVDQAGRDPAALAVDDHPRHPRSACGQFAAGPAKTIRPSARSDRALLDDAEARPHRRKVASRALRPEPRGARSDRESRKVRKPSTSLCLILKAICYNV